WAVGESPFAHAAADPSACRYLFEGDHVSRPVHATLNVLFSHPLRRFQDEDAEDRLLDWIRKQIEDPAVGFDETIVARAVAALREPILSINPATAPTDSFPEHLLATVLHTTDPGLLAEKLAHRKEYDLAFFFLVRLMRSLRPDPAQVQEL